MWKICLLSRSHLSNQHWDRRGTCVILLMDYLKVARDLWCSLLFYQLVRDLPCLLQVVRNPNVVVLISNQILLMSYKVLQAQFRFRSMVFTIMWSNLEQVILLNEFGLQLVSEWYHQSAMRLSVLPLDGLRLMILFRPVMTSKKWSTLNWRHKDFNFGSLFPWRHFHLNY